MVKKFIANVSYSTPLVVPLNDEQPDVTHIKRSLEAFGATDVKITLTKYTGAGEHEFVESKDAGLNRVICVKCLTPKSRAAEQCPGIEE